MKTPLTAEVFLNYLEDESYPIGYTWTEGTLYQEFVRANDLCENGDTSDHPFDCLCWRCR